jgi:glycosyltransferase involved in cell wall biosynthesis
MRIAQVSPTFIPYQGGTGNVCYNNASQLVLRGHTVDVYTPAYPGVSAVERMDGMTIKRLRPLYGWGNAALLPQLAGQLFGYDIIHLHYPFFGGEFAALSARRSGAALVITYHMDALLTGLLGVFEKILRQTVTRLTLRSARRLLFTSLDYGRSSHIYSMLRPEQIGELPNGVDPRRFTPGSPTADLHRRFRSEENAQVVLLVAGLDRAHYFKGVDILLDAIALLPQNVQAVIVGDGDLRLAYERRAAELGLASRVVFPGRISDAELPDYYRLADVTVLPSVTRGEAFGLVLLESLACATPVIASRLPGVRTVVVEGSDGCLVEPGSVEDLRQKLSDLLALPLEQRRQMGLRGRRKVEADYAWPAIAEKLEAIYTGCLERRN